MSCSRESEDSELGLVSLPTAGSHGAQGYHKKHRRGFIASSPTNGTNTLEPSTDTTSENVTDETSQLFPSETYQVQTSSLAALLARIFRLLEDGQELKATEAILCSPLSKSYKAKDLAIFSWRTCRDSYLREEDATLPTSSTRFGKVGIIASNGLCLTQRISAFPKTARGCSLSEVLEENPNPKYYLSERHLNLIQNWNAYQKPLDNVLQISPLEEQGSTTQA